MDLKLKTREEVDKAIEEYKNIVSDDYDFIKSEFYRLFGIHAGAVLFLEKKWLESLKVYRTRCVSEIKNKTKAQEYSFPPPKCIIPTQRANWTTRNIFYASDGVYTSLKETKNVYPENEFYVSQWGFNFDKIEHESIPIISFAVDNMNLKNPWNNVLKNREHIFNTLKTYSSEEEADIISYMTYKISELFVGLDESRYPLTAFIADNLLYPKKNPDELHFPILIFPSVVNETNSCNFAIHPGFVHYYMQLQKVFKCKVTETTGEGISFTYSEAGLPISKTEVQWYSLSNSKEDANISIVSIICNCGHQIDLSNPDRLIFEIEGKKIGYRDILVLAVQKIDYENQKVDWGTYIEEDGIIRGMQYEYIGDFNNICFETTNKKKHCKLTITFQIIQPLVYTEIEEI